MYFWILFGGVSGWAILCGVLWAQKMWAVGSWRFVGLRAKVNASSHLLWLEISVPSRWTIQAGQHVQLWMPRSGYRSFFHLPLFYVASLEESQDQKVRDTNSHRTVYILARHRKGLTKRLIRAATTFESNFPVHVFGPFGHPPHLGKYGTILFVVEDIGLLRILPFLQQLVQDSRRRRTVVRKLEILWKVDWSSIVELELLPEVREDDSFHSAQRPHNPSVAYVERSQFKLWIWDSIQRLFELDRQHLHNTELEEAGDSPSSRERVHQSGRGETGGFDVRYQ